MVTVNIRIKQGVRIFGGKAFDTAVNGASSSLAFHLVLLRGRRIASFL